MNKPFGVKSWLENVLQMNATDDGTTRPKGVEDGVIILMDPDMILLRPITHDFSNQDVIWVEENPATTMVKHGYPMAQQDGYLDNQWMHINGSFVTGDPKIPRPKGKDGPIHWNTGPPYLATVKDMYEISKLWVEYAPRVDHIHPGLFAEMQGFIWATFKLNLPHTLIKSIVVSDTPGQHREGWAYIDNLPDTEVCVPSKAITALPIGLHYCKRYGLGPDFFISKYRIKKNFLTCEQNLLMPPPRNIHTMYDYFIKPPPSHGKPIEHEERTIFKNPNQAKREAFMLCGLIEAFNEAASYFKTHNCRPGANFNKIYTIHNDPKDH
jgi:peptidyl serine alpha-galactosyltransferase